MNTGCPLGRVLRWAKHPIMEDPGANWQSGILKAIESLSITLTFSNSHFSYVILAAGGRMEHRDTPPTHLPLMPPGESGSYCCDPRWANGARGKAVIPQRRRQTAEKMRWDKLQLAVYSKRWSKIWQRYRVLLTLLAWATTRYNPLK